MKDVQHHWSLKDANQNRDGMSLHTHYDGFNLNKWKISVGEDVNFEHLHIASGDIKGAATVEDI